LKNTSCRTCFGTSHVKYPASVHVLWDAETSSA
jgi:hypothetical protein